MPQILCVTCKTAPASMKRPKNGDTLCRPCFFAAVESDTHETITKYKLFSPGEIIACGASGGKDSTVLMHLLTKLNERHNYGVKLVLVSVDEGITGYRDESLVTVKRNSEQYKLPLTIVSYEDLYNGWSMDKIVAQIGNKSNCTYCGVFRRHALEKGARIAGASKIATGHNADDTAETVLMNLLRSDMPRLERCTNPQTNEIADEDAPLIESGENSELVRASIPRVKPMRDLYEKEIVLYAHFQNLDYFSTECTYSKEAFRGNARTLLKQLESISPRCISNILKSGEDLFISNSTGGGGGGENNNNNKKGIQQQQQQPTEEGEGEKNQNQNQNSGGGNQITAANLAAASASAASGGGGVPPQRRDRNNKQYQQQQQMETGTVRSVAAMTSFTSAGSQIAMRCKRCGSLSSRPLCRACVLVDSLNGEGTGPNLAVVGSATEGCSKSG